MFTAITTFSAIFAWVVANQTLLLTIASAVVAVDHFLAASPSLKSNSAFQLVRGFIKAAMNLFSMVFKLATGKAFIIPIEPTTDSKPTPADVMKHAIESPTKLEEGQAAAFQKAFEAADASISDKLKKD